MKLKLFVIACGSLFLSACSSVFYDAQKTWEYAFREQVDTTLSAEEIERTPLTMFYGQIEGMPRTVVIMGFADQTSEIPRLNWITGGRQSISTEYARIVETSGLDRNLVAMSDINEDPLRCVVLAPNNCPTQWIRQIDMASNDQKPGAMSGTETIISEFDVTGMEILTLPSGIEKSVYRVVEEGRFVFARQEFVNEFWIEADGHVVKSKQTMMPNTMSIELTQIKWIGRDGD